MCMSLSGPGNGSPMATNRPVESHSGARENIIAGHHHPPHSVCLEIKTPKASIARKRGERCPLTIRLDDDGRIYFNVAQVLGLQGHVTVIGGRYYATLPELRVRGSIVSSPSGVRGRAAAEHGFYAYFRSERSHLEHHFQLYFSIFDRRRAPQMSRGLGKLPLSPPLDGPGYESCCWGCCYQIFNSLNLLHFTTDRN